MAKSPSPLRLQEELMQSATQAGARHHRSAAEQIDYWAALGRQVCRFVDATIRYQASASQPGALERIAADGSRSTGSFCNGIFIPCEPELG